MTTTSGRSDSHDKYQNPIGVDVFGALASSCRLRTLTYLAGHAGGASLAELAAHVASDTSPSPDRTTLTVVALYHIHLPHLADAGLVRYDAEGRTVTLAVTPKSLEPYLSLARNQLRPTDA